MPKLKLFDIIRENADKIRTEILDKTRGETEAILVEATRSVEDLRHQAHLRVQAEADHLRERKYNTIRFRTNARRYDLKSRALEDIWSEAEEILGKIEQSAAYKNILQALFFECVSMVPDSSVVCASPGDAETVKACIDQSKRPLYLEEDPQIHGGIEFRWPDGKIVLKNTLSHRLSKLKAEGNAELSGILFSSGEDRAV